MTLIQKLWLAGLFMFIAFFLIGLHNIDNAWNMKAVEMQGGTWKDCALIGCFEANKLYMFGVGMTFFGCYLIFMMALFFPYVRKSGTHKRV
jgi:hypothetical protein